MSERFVSTLSENIEKTRAVISRDLLATYNDGWRSYDEAQEDGSYKTLENPELAAGEFQKLFTPTSLKVWDDLVQVLFDDGRAFWGHTVIVALDQGDWDNALAELFG